METDITAAVAKIVDANQPLFETCEIKIHNALTVPCVYQVDRLLFETLVMNLLTNAIRYNDAPAPRLDIRFHQGTRNLTIQFQEIGRAHV